MSDKKIECRECGNKFHNLASHIIKKHGLTSDEYKARYPNAEIVSSHFKETQRTQMKERYKRSDVDFRSIAGKRVFDFIEKKDLRLLLQRDYSSAKKCLKSNLWKPTIILYGSLIEAILREMTNTKTFAEAITKAYEKGIIGEKEYHKIHLIRDLRNFVHIHKELEEKEEINDYWAKTFSDICETIIKKFRS